jgi:hypothetical protein
LDWIGTKPGIRHQQLNAPPASEAAGLNPICLDGHDPVSLSLNLRIADSLPEEQVLQCDMCLCQCIKASLQWIKKSPLDAGISEICLLGLCRDFVFHSLEQFQVMVARAKRGADLINYFIALVSDFFYRDWFLLDGSHDVFLSFSSCTFGAKKV